MYIHPYKHTQNTIYKGPGLRLALSPARGAFAATGCRLCTPPRPAGFALLADKDLAKLTLRGWHRIAWFGWDIVRERE